MRKFTQPNSFLRRHSQSFKWIVVAGIALLLGNHSDAQLKEAPLGDTVKKTESLNTLVPILYGVQQKKYITGAVSYLSGSDVSNIPGTNRINSFTGRLTGLAVTQRSGIPASENSSYQIRGFHSFNGSGTPLVLINNRIDDINEIDPNDIESVTVLKDAASAAMYGLQSANGIILVTTKHGQNGRIRVNYNMETSFEQPTRLPKPLDAYNYAVLYNEAQLNDNPAAVPKYNAAALQAYQTGSDPYLYPNVNWSDLLLKKFSLQTRNNVNISGGNDQVKYYFSGGYLTDNGIFNVDKSINTYNTNTNLNVLNMRANLVIALSKNLTLNTDLRSKREVRNAPGPYSTSYDQTLFSVIYGTPANAYPVRNANGSLGGNVSYLNNPYGLLNYNGYNNYLSTSLTGALGLDYDLGGLVKGLKLKADFGFNSYNDLQYSRTKTFAIYTPSATTPGTYTKTGTDGITPSTAVGSYTARKRIYDHFATLTYDRDFGDHSISALAMYELQQIDDATSTALTQNYQGPKGRVSYRFKNRYLVDFAASYQGSEQFPPNHRYGFFPAVSAGWIVSDESFLKGSAIDFLKIRGSYGKTGDLANGVYFDYLTSYSSVGSAGGAFGTNPAYSIGAYQSQIGSPLVTWESDLKSNIGLDFAVLHNKLSASFDVFKERTTNILVANAISAMYGAKNNTPAGIFEDRGFEVQAGWNDNIGNLQYSITGNLSVAKNKIVYENEATKNYPYMNATGNPLGTRMGYVFDRFFTEADVAGTYPNQSSLGTQKPGDLKYKDLNGDGVIDNNDVTNIGVGNTPEVNYGANLGLRYKAFDMNVYFEGTSHSTTYNSGTAYNEFTNTGKGNVFQNNLTRWTPGSGQSAGYPRLTLSNPNNFVASSFWVQDNSFTRLKYVELGYTLPGNLLKRIGLSSTRVFVNGYNVFLWDKVKYKDPEATESGLTYPLQRSFSVGLNVKF